MVTSPARQAKANRKANRKRNLSPRKDSSKKVDATTSPVRRLRNAVASVTNAVASATDTVLMGAVTNPDNVTAPPLISRNATPSALSTVFDDSALQPPSTKSKNAMCGFIPKSGFLVKMRNLNVPSGPVSEKQMAKEVRIRRESVYWHFDKSGKRNLDKPGNGDGHDDDMGGGRVTRSSVAEEEEDWTVDMDAANGEVTQTRRLDRYSLEHILTLPERTKLLLLVQVSDDSKKFSGKGAKIDAFQNLDRKRISGREYYQLKCSMSDVHQNHLATGGVASSLYNEKTLESDLKGGHAGFGISFADSTDTATFTWRDILKHPSTFMFFGPPVATSRSFDKIFMNPTKVETLHHRYISYYDHFEGDVNACLALHNAYLSKKSSLQEKEIKALKKGTKDHNGGIFRTKKCKDFLKRFDDTCKAAQETVLCDFHNHSLPILLLPTMNAFIEEAPQVSS